MRRLVNDICSGRVSVFPTGAFSKTERITIQQFVSDATISEAVMQEIQHIFLDKPASIRTLYLLRGLLVHRILLLTLKKRWNVQYGLHPNRDPLAVPFHAKGVPSDQAEWGHPDVAILFTCLAHYYEGLHSTQVHLSLDTSSSQTIQPMNTIGGPNVRLCQTL